MMKKQNGITLIALVITIIVLLILAGVSIAMLTGENGILTKASGANEKTTAAEIEEAIKLGVSEILANKLDPTYKGTENVINATNVEAKMKNNNANLSENKIKTVTVAAGTDGEVTVTYSNTANKDTHTWTVSSTGSVTKTAPATGE